MGEGTQKLISEAANLLDIHDLHESIWAAREILFNFAKV